MSTKTTPQTPQTPNVIEALVIFLERHSSADSPVRKTDFLNPTNPINSPLSMLFSSGGILSSKELRKEFLDFLARKGVEVQGKTPADQVVVFRRDFHSSIPTIVADFLGDSKKRTSAAKTAPSVCPNGHVCDSKEHMCRAPAAAGGGAAAGAHSSSKPKSITLAELQKQRKQPKQSKKSSLMCVVCPHTKTDGSGKCKFPACDNFHPFNQNVDLTPHNCKNGRRIHIARICEHFQNGTCQNGERCKFAHLSSTEYEAVIQKEQARQSETAKVSPKKPTSRPSVIVPSQVHFGRQPQTQRSEEMPSFAQPSTIDPFIFAGLSAVADGLQESAFGDVNLFLDWSNFMRGEGEEITTPSHRSYSPAVEVTDSSDDEEDEEEDE